MNILFLRRCSLAAITVVASLASAAGADIVPRSVISIWDGSDGFASLLKLASVGAGAKEQVTGPVRQIEEKTTAMKADSQRPLQYFTYIDEVRAVMFDGQGEYAREMIDSNPPNPGARARTLSGSPRTTTASAVHDKTNRVTRIQFFNGEDEGRRSFVAETRIERDGSGRLAHTATYDSKGDLEFDEVRTYGPSGVLQNLVQRRMADQRPGAELSGRLGGPDVAQTLEAVFDPQGRPSAITVLTATPNGSSQRTDGEEKPAKAAAAPDTLRFSYPHEREVEIVRQSTNSPAFRFRVQTDDHGLPLDVRTFNGESLVFHAKYEYEFDSHGNWTKRTRSKLVERFGDRVFENNQVVERTIEYAE